MKITNAVMKIAGTCNLNCSYCYVFNMGDKSFLEHPSLMSEEIALKSIDRIKDYCARNEIKYFLVILHGGEPLLRGKDFFRKLVTYTNSITSGSDIDIKFVIQTNGTLLNEEWIDLLKELGIQFGVSIDGTKENHDHYRVYKKDGKGSFEDVKNAIELCCKKRVKVAALSVANVSQNPLEVYNEIKQLGISSVSFLLPDLNYIHCPDANDVPKVGEWLIEMYKVWSADSDKNKLRDIQPISTLYAIAMGLSKYGMDNYGRRFNDVFSIQTDGAIEPVDTFKPCGDGFTKTSLNILTDDIEELHKEELMNVYYHAHQDSCLCDKCKKCIIVDVCGGGHAAHRYSQTNGFNNPSIYCQELSKLITYVQNRVVDDLPTDLVENEKLYKLTLQDVQESQMC